MTELSYLIWHNILKQAKLIDAKDCRFDKRSKCGISCDRIVNINTSAIRGLWYVTLTNLMNLTLLTGDAMLCRPKVLNTVSLAGVSYHRRQPALARV